MENLSGSFRRSVNLACGLCLLTATCLSAQEVGWRESPDQAPSTGAKTAFNNTEALSEAERLRSQRRANAHELDFFLPYFEVAADRDTRVVLMNTVSDPVSVLLTARNHYGVLPLGTWVLESLNHQEISLRDHLVGYLEEFATGYLTVTLLGDKDTLQGWGIVQNRKGTFEIPLTTQEEISDTSFLAHWDSLRESADLRDQDIRFLLVNTSAHQVTVQVAVGGNGREKHGLIELGPEENIWVDTVENRPLKSQSWARFSHDAGTGDLLVLGLHGGSTPSGVIPISAASAIQASKLYESIPLPSSTPLEHTWLTLFNPGLRTQRIDVETLDAETGRQLSRSSLTLGPARIRSVPLARVPDSSEHPVRLRVSAEEPPLGVSGVTHLDDGEARDLTFFPFADVHTNGTYPLLDNSRFETVTTVVNLGKEPSRIGAQVFWEGGTYSLAPISIPPGGSHQIDLEKVAQEARPDLLGRTLDSERSAGVLKWTLLRGSDSLIGRTEVRPRTSQDLFGFNCYGCCWEIPTASIVPSQVSFTPYEIRSFEACLTISDCAGTLGPFPTTSIVSMSVPSPFTWDGSTITAPTAADADISFETQEIETKPTCFQFLKWLFGFGRADMCQESFNKKNYKEPCDVNAPTSCLECESCCHAIALQQLCQGKDGRVVESNRTVCIGNCLATWEGNGCEGS